MWLIKVVSKPVDNDGAILQGSVYRAARRDGEEAAALLGSEVAVQRDDPLDSVETRVGVIGVVAIGGVDVLVVQVDANVRQGPALAACVGHQRHRRAGAERRRQEVVRTGSTVQPAIALRFIGKQSVSPGFDNLLEAAFSRRTDEDAFALAVF